MSSLIFKTNNFLSIYVYKLRDLPPIWSEFSNFRWNSADMTQPKNSDQGLLDREFAFRYTIGQTSRALRARYMYVCKCHASAGSPPLSTALHRKCQVADDDSTTTRTQLDCSRSTRDCNTRDTCTTNWNANLKDAVYARARCSATPIVFSR